MEFALLCVLVLVLLVDFAIYLLSPLPEQQKRQAVVKAQEALFQAWSTTRLQVDPPVAIEWFEVEPLRDVVIHLVPGTVADFSEAERRGLRRMAAKVCNTIGKRVMVTFVHRDKALAIRPSFFALLLAIGSCFPSLRRPLPPEKAQKILQDALARKPLPVEPPVGIDRFEVAADFSGVTVHLGSVDKTGFNKAQQEGFRKFAAAVCTTIGRCVPVTFICNEEAYTIYL